jgi:hypothetical protein
MNADQAVARPSGRASMGVRSVQGTTPLLTRGLLPRYARSV